MSRIGKAPITVPIARPRRAGGTTSATMDNAIEVAGPPKAPATTRESSRVNMLLAAAPAKVPTTRPAPKTSPAP